MPNRAAAPPFPRENPARQSLRLLVWGGAILLGIAAEAADWPRLGGPDASGVSPETGLARAWPAAGPRVVWTVGVGEGFAGAAIRDGRVFLLDRTNAQDVLRCFNLADGRESWRRAFDAPGSLPFKGSRSVPSVDESMVFALGPFGDFLAVSVRTHEVVWKSHLVNDFKDPAVDQDSPPADRREKLARAQVPMWGFTQAPLLYGDLVIIAPQTERTGLVAYERATGRIRWRSDYLGRNWFSHVSPALARLGGVDQVIMLAQPSDPERSPDEAPPAIISSVDPRTGAILWRTLSPRPYKIPIPQPLAIGDDRLLITGGLKMGCFMLQVTNQGGVWSAKVLFHHREVAAHIHSPVAYRDRIYVTSFKEDGASRTGLVCLSREGRVLWETGPDLQFDAGGFLIADGMVFAMHGKRGELNLLELGETGATVLAKAKVLEARDGNVWAPLALSGGMLVVRDQHEMKCLEVRAEQK